MARKSSRRSNIKYLECWHNHAARIGRHAVDGCGEFAPGGEEGTELAFLCKACGCHRNFHRKELIKKGTNIRESHLYPPLNRPPSSYRDYCRHYMHESGREVLVDDEESVIDNDGETKVEMRAMKRPKEEPF